MKFRLLLFIILLIPLKLLFAQGIGDFRTKQNGNWNQTTTWQRFNGSSWVNATSTPTYTDGVITVQNGHTVTVSADVQIDQTIVYGTIIINASQELRIIDGSGTDLQVYGTITNFGTLRHHTSGSPTLAYNAGAKYTHALNGDRVEYATWHSHATCEITGITGSKPSRMDQYFGHVVWNCNGQTSDINLVDDLNQIQGNFSVISTNNKYLELSNTSTRTMSVGGNFLISSGYFVLSDGSADNIMNVNGNFTISGGCFYMSTGSGYTTLNIKGDFNMTGGQLQQNSSYNRAVINFNGTSPQIFTRSAGIMYYGLSFVVKAGASVDFGTSVLGNHLYTTGTFTLESGAALKTAHNEGITTSGASGCIQVQGTRSYNANAHYMFCRNGTQATGNGFPVSLSGILTIGSTGSATNLSLSNGSVTINNKLVLTSNALNNSSISGTIIYGTNGILEYQGASAQTTTSAEFPSANGPRSVIINNSQGVSLHASRTIETSLNLTIGQFAIGNNTLTLRGSIVRMAGSWSGSTESNLVMEGSSASTNLPAIELNNLTINRANGIGLAGAISIHGTTNMTNGVLTSNGYNLVYGSNGSLQYNGSVLQTSGNAEFPASNGPKNLNVSNPAGLALHASRTINGNLTLGSGAFSIGDNILTINGLINQIAGSLSGGASSAIIFGENEATALLPEVILNNLTVNRSAGVNLDGNVTILSNLNLLSGAMSIGNYTLSLDGAINTLSGSLCGDKNSILVFGGSAPAANLQEITLGTLTINRPQGVLLAGDLTIKSQLQLFSGNLQIGANTIFMDGDFQQTIGGLSGGVNSNIIIRPDLLAFMTVNLPGVELALLSVNRTAGVNLAGNLTVHQGLVLESGNLSIGSNTVTLNGELSEAGGSLQATENSSLVVGGSGTTLNIGMGTLKSFQLNRASGIQIFNNLQIFNQLTLIDGNINLNGFELSYMPGAMLRYAGNKARICRNGEFPENNGPTNLEIINPAGVELHESRTIPGSLVLMAGNFQIASNMLSLNGNLIAGFSEFSGKLIGGDQSDLNIGGHANLVNLNGIVLKNLSINRPMGVVMLGDLDLFGMLTLENGQIDVMNNKLILRNPINGNPDLLILLPESSLEIAGEAEGMNIGPEENIRINDIKNLTISNTHETGVRLNGDLQIWSNLKVEPFALFIIGENKNLTIHAIPNL